mgnify:CR=1 FL=1
MNRAVSFFVDLRCSDCDDLPNRGHDRDARSEDLDEAFDEDGRLPFERPLRRRGVCFTGDPKSVIETGLAW